MGHASSTALAELYSSDQEEEQEALIDGTDVHTAKPKQSPLFPWWVWDWHRRRRRPSI
jgi:hypothetical protein